MDHLNIWVLLFFGPQAAGLYNTLINGHMGTPSAMLEGLIPRSLVVNI